MLYFPLSSITVSLSFVNICRKDSSTYVAEPHYIWRCRQYQSSEETEPMLSLEKQNRKKNELTYTCFYGLGSLPVYFTPVVAICKFYMSPKFYHRIAWKVIATRVNLSHGNWGFDK